MGWVHFSALGSGFGLWDFTWVGSRVNEFWFGFIPLFFSFFSQFALILATSMEKYFLQLVKKISLGYSGSSKNSWGRFWPNPSLIRSIHMNIGNTMKPHVYYIWWGQLWAGIIVPRIWISDEKWSWEKWLTKMLVWYTF